MSDTGLNSSTFYMTRKYLRILTDFMLLLKDNPSQIDEKSGQELKNLFEDLRDDDTTEPKIQSLNVILESELRNQDDTPEKFYSQIVSNFIEHDYSTLLKNLSIVVRALDTEYSHSLAKFKNG